MQTVEKLAIEAYLQYGALFLLAISGWVAAWTLYKDLLHTRAKFDSLQTATLKQLGDLTNVLKDLTDARRLEDLVRDLSKKS